jgi:hypothetical protein
MYLSPFLISGQGLAEFMRFKQNQVHRVSIAQTKSKGSREEGFVAGACGTIYPLFITQRTQRTQREEKKGEEKRKGKRD